jgi:hypothetical protein
MSDPVFRFTNPAQRVVSRTWPDGRVESCSVDAPQYLIWLDGGNAALPYAPTVVDYTNAIQSHLDGFAKSWGYDSIFTAVTYAEEPTVAQFQAEGQALRAWRSQVWAAAYTLLAEVQGGQREAPTLEGIVDELPAAPDRP